MARKKIGLHFEGWEEMMGKLDKLGGTSAMKKGVEAGLIASKEYINPLIEQSMNKLPAKGKYSTGDTMKSIDRETDIEWEGMSGAIKIGFNFKESGMKSIFLMYGTPRMKPAQGLKASIYGAKTKKEIAQIQSDAVNKVIKQIMEG